MEITMYSATSASCYVRVGSVTSTFRSAPPCNILLRLLVVLYLSTCIRTSDLGLQPGRRTLQSDGHVPSNAAFKELLDCYNKRPRSRFSNFTEYVDGSSPRSLRLHQVWWSSKHATLPLTIFTPTDLSRITSLAAQCRSYPGGPLAAAVYVPLIQRGPTNATADLNPQELSPAHLETLRNATEKLDALFQEMEAPPQFSRDPSGGGASSQPGACALRLLMVYELVADDVMALLMPVNPMRNVAMLAATTPLVAMVDVDLSISLSLTGHLLANLSEGSRAHKMLEAAEQQQKMAWIMPAWDTNRHLKILDGNKVADAAVAVRPDDKRTLMQMWKVQDTILPFAFDVFKLGHNSTNYARWLQSNTVYEVRFQKRYEPWFIAPRKTIPLYDARFRGYAPDKALHLVSIAKSGFRFYVLPDVWLVHRPHEPAASCYIYDNLAKRSTGSNVMSKVVSVFGHLLTVRQAVIRINNRIFDTGVAAMDKQQYKVMPDEGAEHCRNTLSWWR